MTKTKKRDAYYKELPNHGKQLLEYWNPKFGKENLIHKHGEIWHDTANDWLCIKWGNAQTQESIKMMCETMMKHMVELKVFRILNDNTEVKYPWNHSHRWISEEWLPAMVKSGLTDFSWVVGTDVFSITSVKTHPMFKGFTINTRSSFEASKRLHIFDLDTEKRSHMTLFEVFEQAYEWIVGLPKPKTAAQ